MGGRAEWSSRPSPSRSRTPADLRRETISAPCEMTLLPTSAPCRTSGAVMSPRPSPSSTRASNARGERPAAATPASTTPGRAVSRASRVVWRRWRPSSRRSAAAYARARVGGGDRGRAGQPPGGQRVVDALAGQRVDERQRVAGEQHRPAGWRRPGGRQRQVVADEPLGLDAGEQLAQPAVQDLAAAAALPGLRLAQPRQQHAEADVGRAVARAERPRVGRPAPAVHDDRAARARPAAPPRSRGRRPRARSSGCGARRPGQRRRDDAVRAVGADDRPGPQPAVEHDDAVAHLQRAHLVADEAAPAATAASTSRASSTVRGTTTSGRRSVVATSWPPGATSRSRRTGTRSASRSGDAEPGQLVQRVRRHAVAAALVAREVGAVQQQHPRARPGAQRRQRGGRAGRSRADDDEVPRLRGPRGQPAPPAGPSQPGRRRGSGRLAGMSRPRVLSGIRPTGAGFHLGNYLGAVRHWAAMQDENECFYFIADLHALTEDIDPEHLRAAPARPRPSSSPWASTRRSSVLFAQGHVPEHVELALGAGLPHRLRRGLADDAVQGQGRRQRRPVHLSRPAGRRHPAVPPGRRADRRGPAPAPRADPRPRAALQQPVRRGLHAARPYADEAGRAHQGPAGPGPQDEQEHRRRRHAVGARRAEGAHQEGEERRHRPGREVRGRSRGQAGRHQPADDPVSVATGTPVPELEQAYAGKGYGDFKGDVAQAVVELFAPVRERYEALRRRPGRDRRGAGRRRGARPGGRHPDARAGARRRRPAAAPVR